jgi:hypothetical protein
MEKINFISGGKTGDLLHNMYVVNQICQKENKLANIFITDNLNYGGDNFHFQIDKTFNDLKPFFEYQKYVNSFNILKTHLNTYVNLNSWRGYFLFGQVNWINLLSSLNNIPQLAGNWLEFEKNNSYSDVIAIHRSTHRHTNSFPWEKIVNENNCVFVTTDIKEFEMFPYNKNVTLKFCESFTDLALIINSAKFFIGNMSTPLALAHSLGVPRLAELFRYDEIFYIGEEKLLSNYYYYSENYNNYLNGIEKYIKL